MDNFFVVINESDDLAWSRLIWSEVDNVANIYCNSIDTNSRILNKIKKIHFSNEINRYIWLPLKCIWNKRLVIKEDILNPADRNFIIFHGNVKFAPSYILNLKKNKNAVIILYLLDTVEKLKIAKDLKEYEAYLKRFHIDFVYSFDKQDCEKYNMNFFDAYSRISFEETSNNIEYDISYVGNCRNKNRLKLIKSIALSLNSLRKKFYINGVSDENKEIIDDVVYNESLPYKNVVELLKRSNCILELINESQNGNTLRFKEAVCYNKKLLTNNKEVKKSPYYNPKYIQVFSQPDEIDSKWITEQSIVDYKYGGDFSPSILLERIKADAIKRGL